jgi:hypothetical protein
MGLMLFASCSKAPEPSVEDAFYYPISKEFEHSVLQRVEEFEPSTYTEAVHKIQLMHANGKSLSSLPVLLRFDSSEKQLGFQFPIKWNAFGQLVVERKAIGEVQGERHQNQLLAALGKVDAPLSTEIVLRNDKCSCGDLFESAKRNFVMGDELEWTIIAFVLHAKKSELNESWSNRFGEKYCLNDLIDELLLSEREDLACSGTHMLHALAVVLERDRHEGFLGSYRRGRARKAILDASEWLEEHQFEFGAWNFESRDGRKTLQFRPLDLVSATGHHLEWISLVDSSLRPSREHVLSAVRFFVGSLKKISDSELKKTYCGISHGTIGIANFLEEEQNAETK